MAFTPHCMDVYYMNVNSFYRHYSSLEVASEYFRSGADKISIGSDAVYAAEDFLRTGVCNNFHNLPSVHFCFHVDTSLYMFLLIVSILSGKNWKEQYRADI